jgi:hypothetical protein
MGWTTPRNWTNGEVVSQSIMNTHIRDNLLFLRQHHGVYVWKSANQTIPNGNNDVISWNSESYDTDAFHDPVTNNSRVTIPAGFDGYYLVVASIDSDADASNHTGFLIRIRKNAAGLSSGGTLLETAWGVGHSLRYSVNAMWQGSLTAGEYLEVFANASSEAHDVQGGAVIDSSFTAILLGN